MARVAVISNPHAARRRSVALQRELERASNVQWFTTSSPEDADARIASVADDVDLLVLDGGDGTVQRALSALFQAREARSPSIAILPGGSTNMTAYDISGPSSWRKSAAQLLRLVNRDPTEWPRTPRPVIRLQSAGDGSPVYGMCFGAGAVISGIEYCHDWIYRLGIRGEWAPGLALARTVWGLATHEKAFSTPVDLTVALENEATLVMPAKLMLVSAIKRMFLGFTPFWGSGEGALRCTIVRHGADAFVRTLPSFLRGRPSPRMTLDGGYWSEKLNSVRVSMRAPYAVDGEIFPAPASGTLELRATAPIEFVKLI